MLKYKEIKQLGKVITGKTPPTEDESNFGGNIPFITPSDIKSFNERYIVDTERTISESGSIYVSKNILPNDSICFVCIGSTIGKMCMTGTQSYTNQQLNSIIPFANVDNHYLFYLLRYFKGYFQLLGGGTGSGKGIVKKSTFEKSKIPYDDNIDNQKKIASILSAYDSLIENNNKRIKLLEQIAENLYKEWFVRFRFPGYETAEFEGGVPKGWKHKPLGEIASFERGLSYSSEEIDCGDGLNLVNLKNIEAFGGYRRDGLKHYNGKYKTSQIVKKGDLVMGVTDMTQDRRTVGAVAMIPNIPGTSVISADLVKIVSKQSNLFLYCLCRFGYYSFFFSQFANGANVLHLKPNTLLSKKVLIPSNTLITMFVEKVQPNIDCIDNLYLQNDLLTHQRDLLLPRLMSSKLSI